MGKAKKPTVQVTEYRMSILYGICLGPIDTLWRIFVGEKQAWEGGLTAKATVDISERELFGGIKQEGGVEGRLFFLPGADDQVLDETLAARLGRTAATCPAFRGLAALFFTGDGDTDGFYWSANSPYVRGTWAEVTCIEKHANAWAWYPEKAKVPRLTEADL